MSILCATINQVSIYGTFLICQFLAIWLSNTILHHKVNGTCTCFIFSFCNLNEWIHPWLSIQRFIIMWSPFLFLMRPRVVYFALLNLPLKYQFSVYSHMWGLFASYIWQRYSTLLANVLLSFCMYLTGWHLEELLVGHPTEYSKVTLSLQIILKSWC